MNYYPLGTVVTVTANFLSGTTPVDPSTVTLRYEDPKEVEVVVLTANLTHGGVGVFSYNITALVAGVWFYRFEGAGAAIAVQEGNFCITSSEFEDAA